MATSKHITILDPLRGVAAIAVVLFHYSVSVLPTISKSRLTSPFSLGEHGVEVLFVISGFIIPYAMRSSGYTWSHLRRFLARRYVRIAPPAYLAATLMVLFYYIAVFLKGQPVEGNKIPALTIRTILDNLTFISGYSETGWFNFVYWSLIAEFEFYVLLALIFPFLRPESPKWAFILILVAFALAPFIADPKLFGSSAYFLFGMLVFMWTGTDMGRTILAVVGVLAVSLGAMVDGFIPVVISMVAALLIASKNHPSMGRYGLACQDLLQPLHHPYTSCLLYRGRVETSHSLPFSARGQGGTYSVLYGTLLARTRIVLQKGRTTIPKIIQADRSTDPAVHPSPPAISA